MFKARAIYITPVLNGFKLVAGCQEVVFTELDMMLAEIGRYYKYPEKVEKEYLLAAVNELQTEPISINPVRKEPERVEFHAGNKGAGQPGVVR